MMFIMRTTGQCSRLPDIYNAVDAEKIPFHSALSLIETRDALGIYQLNIRSVFKVCVLYHSGDCIYVP